MKPLRSVFFILLGLLSAVHSSSVLSIANGSLETPAVASLPHAPISMHTPSNPTALSPQTGDQTQVWNFKDMDLLSLIKQVGKNTGKNFVVNPAVKGKATFVSNKPLTIEEQYQAFLTILQVQGYTAVPRGRIIEIVPDRDAMGASSRLYLKNAPASEMMVTVKHVNSIAADEMARLLTPMLGKNSYVGAYPASNDLIIADRKDNIDTVSTLVNMIDAHSNEKMEVVHLKYAPAEDIAKTLAALYTNPNRSMNNLPTQVSFAADPRSRSIVIRGGSAQQRGQLRAIVMKLDSPFSVTNNETEVIALKHLRAQNLAPILSSLVQSYIAQTQSTNGSSLAQQTSSNANQGDTNRGFNLMNPIANLSGGNGSSSGDNSSGLQNPFADQIISKLGDNKTNSGSISPYIQWEDSTNSIVITAPVELMKKLKNVIKKLDVRRPQIMIEAVIAEISTDKASELGTELSFGGRFQFNSRFDPTMPVTVISDSGQLGNARSDTTKSFGSGLALSYGKTDILRVLLKALHTDTHNNILATPNIVTLDNEPAQIKVGRKVSFAIGSINNNPTGGNPFTSFQRESVGLMLTIRPQITTKGTIKLVIDQEMSDVIPGTLRAGGNPDTTERSIRTTVMVKDGETLVLGGLLQKQDQGSTEHIPLLSKIPVIGGLFRDTQKEVMKTNLMVFLHPMILDGDDALVKG
jgi:general secretion pathway protein D